MSDRGLKKRKKLILVSNQAFSLVNFRGELIKDLIESDIDVVAMAPDHDERSRQMLAELGATHSDYKLDRTGIGLLSDFSTLIQLYSIFKKENPDAILSYFMKPVIYGSIAGRLAGVTKIFSLVAGLGYTFSSREASFTVRQKMLRALATTLYRIAFSCCERVFFQNKDDIEEMVTAGCLPVSKAVCLSGTGVNLDILRPKPIPSGPITFFLMARLLKQKGIREYAAAAEILKSQGVPCRFLLLGGLDQNPNGLSKSEVLAWVKDGTLEWEGHINDVLPYIEQSHVFVLPSYYREGVPRSAQEAMALGRPVITTDNIGCRETVIDGVTGFMVPPRDVAALAEAMKRFIDEPELVETMGFKSRELVEQKFDVRKVNATMLRNIGYI